MLPAVRKRLRIIDAVGLSVALTVLATALTVGMFPLYRHAAANTAQAATYQDQLLKLDGLAKSQARAEAALRLACDRLAESEKRLPTKGNMDDFMRQLSKVADDAGLQVDTIAPKQLLDSPDYKIMPVQIAGTGSYENCYKFLIGLRKLDRLTRLDDLILQVERANEDVKDPKSVLQPICRMNVQISTFMAR